MNLSCEIRKYKVYFKCTIFRQPSLYNRFIIKIHKNYKIQILNLILKIRFKMCKSIIVYIFAKSSLSTKIINFFSVLCYITSRVARVRLV